MKASIMKERVRKHRSRVTERRPDLKEETRPDLGGIRGETVRLWPVLQDRAGVGPVLVLAEAGVGTYPT